MTREEMANAYAEGFENEKYRQIAYDAFLCGFTAKGESFLPSNLDEAAEEQYPDFSDSIASKAAVDAVRDAFKDGAKWMAEQGETKEGIVVDNNDFIDFEDNSFIDVCPTLDKKAFNLHDGEKVIVQIRKKEE